LTVCGGGALSPSPTWFGFSVSLGDDIWETGSLAPGICTVKGLESMKIPV